MPRRGWTLSFLVGALVAGTLAVAPPAVADDGPARTIAAGATVVDATFDGQTVLLQGDDLELADAFHGTMTAVPDSTGATALGLDSRGDQWVLWRRGADIASTDLRSRTNHPMPVPEDAVVLGVGDTTASVLLAVPRPSPQEPAFWLLDPQVGITDLLPDGARDPILSADGNDVWYVLGDGLYRKYRHSEPSRYATIEPGEHLDAVSPEGYVVALARADSFRLVNSFGFPDRVVATGSAPHVVGLRAFDDGGVTYTTQADGTTQLRRWDFDEHAELVGVDEAGQPLALDGPVQVSRDGSTVTFQTSGPDGATLWAHDRLSGTTWVLARAPRLVDLAVGRSGGQIAWTEATTGGELTSRRWDRPIPRLRAYGLGTYEGSQDSWITVEIEAPQHGTTRLRYQPVGADPSGDLTGTTGVVDVPEGQRFAQVPFGIIDDKVREDDESFQLRVTWDDGRPGESIATITIQDDDDKPYLGAFDATASEHDGQLTWNLTLDRPWDQPVSVDWSVGEARFRPATAGADFVPTSGTVTFEPGQTSVPVSARLVDDDEVEPTEEVVLTASSSAVRYGVTAFGLIYDDDVAPPVASVADAHAGERSGSMTWAVSLDRPSAKDVTVAWRAFTDTSAPADRRAADGKDFRSASGVVTIPAGATQVTVSAQVLDDLLIERDEWFVVELSSPAHAVLARAKAVGVINDDESAALWAVPRQVARLLPA